MIEALEALGDTINFIDVCLKLLEENYDVKSEACNTAMKDILEKIPKCL